MEYLHFSVQYRCVRPEPHGSFKITRWFSEKQVALARSPGGWLFYQDKEMRHVQAWRPRVVHDIPSTLFDLEPFILTLILRNVCEKYEPLFSFTILSIHCCVAHICTQSSSRATVLSILQVNIMVLNSHANQGATALPPIALTYFSVNMCHLKR